MLCICWTAQNSVHISLFFQIFFVTAATHLLKRDIQRLKSLKGLAFSFLHRLSNSVAVNLSPFFFALSKPQFTNTMKGLHVAIIALCSLFAYTGDGKSSSAKGSKGIPCFEQSEECTEREGSGKGSKGSKGSKGGDLPYAIWCKEGEREVCRNSDPKSHSIDRYQFGRCDFCGYVAFIYYLPRKREAPFSGKCSTPPQLISLRFSSLMCF